MSAEYFGTTSVVALYQAPQTAYEVFDKVAVLFEGRQIFFGKTGDAKEYFVRMGFECPEQSTTPDFLTSLTSSKERRARPGFERRVPNSAAEFDAVWRASDEYAALQKQISVFNQKYPFDGPRLDAFKSYRRAQQSKHM